MARSKRSRSSKKAAQPKPAAEPAASVPARSHRYTPEQREHALTLVVGGMERGKVADKVGCTTESLRSWYNAAAKAGTLPKVPGPNGHGAMSAADAMAMVKAAAPAGTALPTTPILDQSSQLKGATSAPKDPGAGLGEHEEKAILDYKKKHPSMGPAQIRAQLKRFLGWRISVKAIAGVLRRAGYVPVHRAGRPVGDEHPQRFEAPYRSALWQLDYTELRVGTSRRWLLVVVDDFSRFCVGHRLAEGPTSEVAVEVMREAIRLHGKCERVYTDRGSSFIAWRDVTSFEAFLESELIEHSLRRAHRPQGGGKVEALIQTVQRELWEVQHFDTVEEAEQALAKFFVEYNHRRAHTGIGGLVPADRFYGRWPEVVAEMDAVSRRRQGALALVQDRRLYVEPPPPAERVVLLQLVVVGDQAELVVNGRRIRLGHVEA